MEDDIAFDLVIEDKVITLKYYDSELSSVSLSCDISSGSKWNLDGEVLSGSSLNISLPAISNPSESTEFVRTLELVSEDKSTVVAYSLKTIYIPAFSFSTGKAEDYTHSGPYVLAGYLTLNAADTGTGYIVVKKPGEAVPDFATLKAEAPDYQTYNLKKDQPQWSALVNLEPETEYSVYIGIESDGKTYMEGVSAATVVTNHSDWGMLFDVDNNQLVRKIRVYEGQGMVLPGVLNRDIVPSFLPGWRDVGSDNEDGTDVVLSQGYLSVGGRTSNYDVLGEGWSGSPHPQYHIWVFEVPSGPSGLYYGGEWQFFIPDATPYLLRYEIEIVQGN